MKRECRQIVAALAVACATTTSCFAQVVYLEKTPRPRSLELKSGPWIETIAREVPPLENDAGDHMPMIMWHSVGFEPLEPDQIEVLRARGLCQHLQLSESMIPAAKVLGQAGVPVILMEGRTDSWPYSLASSPLAGASNWAHQFDLLYQQPWFGKEDAQQWHGACPHKTDGWKILAEQTKQTLQKFRDAGVRVDAVLVDYEGDPYPWSHLFEQLKHCKRCRRELPREIIHNKSAWRDYAWKQYVSLYDEFFAKPIREVFPDCLVTNWHVVFSSEVDPVRYFVGDVKLPALSPEHFNATNPVAYASDAVWHELWDASQELTQDAVDAFYTEQIVQQVAADKRNRDAAGATAVRSIPWVSRVCRIADDSMPPAPIMSRGSYRESLHELWELRVHSVQIFNPMYEGYEELALSELQDAVAAYDRMLATKR
jgi:hypothetical protein